MSTLNPFRTLAIWLTIIALAAGLGGCGDDEDKNLVVVGVSATPALLGEGDVTIVEALVTNRSGNPQDDETVYFSVVPAGAGVFAATSANTNALGIATVTFTASTAGTALIGARVGNNPSTEYGTIVIEGEDGGGNNSSQLILTITPSIMPADNASVATVVAEVSDRDGNPIANGTAVKFTAGEKFTDVDGDGLWTDNVDELEFDADGDGKWDPFDGAIDPAIDYTDGGIASSTFAANLTPGLVHIKVTAGDVEDRISDDITLLLTSATPITFIVLTPEWQQIQVRGTGGIESARIVAETFTANGSPGAEGELLDFTMLSGPGGGETIGAGSIGPVTAITNALGQAFINVHAGTLPGTVRIRARSGSVVSTATQVTIRSGPPAFISIGAEQCNAPSWELVGYDNEITAVVVDDWGNEVPDSTSVYFGTEQGLIEGAAETQAVPTLRGKAVTNWTSGLPKNDQYAYIWCETSGGTVADTGFFLESGPPRQGSFLEVPVSLPADGTSEGLVIVEVLDLHGAFVAGGTPVEMHVDFGLINSGLTSDGCHASTYLTYYRSEILDRDYSYTVPDNGIGVVATLTARAGGTSGFFESVQIPLLTGKAASRLSKLDFEGSVPHGASIPVDVTIKDYYGNPLGGHLIAMTSEFGSVTGSPQYTNEFGIASGFVYTAPSSETLSADIISARDLDPGYGGLIVAKKVTITN